MLHSNMPIQERALNTWDALVDKLPVRDLAEVDILAAVSDILSYRLNYNKLCIV